MGLCRIARLRYFMLWRSSREKPITLTVRLPGRSHEGDGVEGRKRSPHTFSLALTTLQSRRRLAGITLYKLCKVATHRTSSAGVKKMEASFLQGAEISTLKIYFFFHIFIHPQSSFDLGTLPFGQKWPTLPKTALDRRFNFHSQILALSQP